jgi:hypothetical protein
MNIWRRFFARVDDNLEFMLFQGSYAAIFLCFIYLFGLWTRDGEIAAVAIWISPFFYLVWVPFVLRGVAIRTPSGDYWRAVAALIYGALPFALLASSWRTFTSWPLSALVFPAILAWASAAIYMALRANPPARSPAMRTLSLGGAGVISGLAALFFFGAAGIGLLISVWNPPPDAVTMTSVLLAICLPTALLMGFTSLMLFRAIHRQE